MGVFRRLLIFVFFTSALCDEALLDPCEYKDVECLRRATHKFLDKTAAGIPEFSIMPVDPIYIQHVEYADPGSDIVMHFMKITVTGLKKQNVTDFQMDTTAKTVVLQSKIEANIVSDLTVELKGPAKFLSGTYSAKTVTLGTAKYNYELKPNDKGVDFFDVGPETITCESVGEPEVTLDPSFAETISKDPDAAARRADYLKRATEIRQKAVCKIIAVAYGTVISNLRAAAKVLPKSAFFKDI